MGEDKGHRCGQLAHGGEHPRHKPAQAIGPGEVGEPRRGKPLDHPSGHPGYGAAAHAAQPGAGEHQQHQQHPAQGHAPKGNPREGEHHHPHRGHQRRQVPAVVHRAGAALAVAGEAQQQVGGPPQEVGAPRPQKGLRHIQGRGVV